MDFKKGFILLSVLFVLLVSISGVAAGSFTELQENIDTDAADVLDVNEDYVYNEVSDKSISEKGVSLNRSNYVINGNNHTVDAKSSSKIFNIKGSNITINDFKFLNVKETDAIFINSSRCITLNNCIFTNVYDGLNIENSSITLNNITYCSNSLRLVESVESNVNLYDSSFNNLNNISDLLFAMDSNISCFNSNFTNIHDIKESLFSIGLSNLYVTDCVFNNLNSDYNPVIKALVTNVSVENSKFSDVSADLTGGVIISKSNQGGNEFINIINSEFNHCTSTKNAGVLYADVIYKINILSSKFLNGFSDFGGAIVALDSNLFINDSQFVNNKATYDGAAIYTSYTKVNISNSSFENNTCLSNKDIDSTCGGALYIDKSDSINVDNSKFINNKATNGGALYIYDSNNVTVSNSYFKNNKEAIYGVFTDDYNLKNNKLNNDVLSLNNTFYVTVVDVDGVKYKLLNNSLDTSKLPSSFDLRDYGWVTPVRNQGDKGFCWVFGTCGALESALLRYTGLEFDISENNIGNLMLKYSKFGNTNLEEAGSEDVAVGYLLAWLGTSDTMFDTYDQYGKISPIIAQFDDYHVQNVVMLNPCKGPDDIVNINKIKEALMKYGALTFSYYHDEEFYNEKTASYYNNKEKEPNHPVTLVGWDDNYSADNFVFKYENGSKSPRPSGNGAWIIKNSWGTDFGDAGYMYISYYDTSILKDNTFGFIINDTIIYNKNYQYDISGTPILGLTKKNKYANKFTAIDDDLIAAVGTYFAKVGEKYTIQVSVNDKLVYTQKGVSKFAGYVTIPLDKYIKVSKGDSFFISVESNTIPLVMFSREYVSDDSSFIYTNHQWMDLNLLNNVLGIIIPDGLNCVASLKAYTIDNADFKISAPNLVIKHGSNKYLDISLTDSKGVPIINAKIKVLIKGKSGNYVFNVVTDENGIAHVSLKNIPVGRYSVEYSFKFNGHQICMNHSSLVVEPADISKSNSIPMKHTGIPILVLLIALFALPFSLRRK